MLQSQQKQYLDKVLKEICGDNYLLIKIHGGRYQLAGLPDFLILTPSINFWLEHKRNDKDLPTPIQRHMLKKLRRYGFVTGIITGDTVTDIESGAKISLKKILTEICGDV